MLKSFASTVEELLDSKKGVMSFAAVLLASLLHVLLKIPVESALLLVSPLAAGTLAQAHVDAAKEKAKATIAGQVLEVQPDPPKPPPLTAA